MTQYGYYSIVAHKTKPGLFQVRAHVRRDLENLCRLVSLDNEIQDYAGSEYAFRIVLDGEELRRAMAALCATIDYFSLKQRIDELPDQRSKSDTYADMWAGLAGMREPTPEEVNDPANGVRPASL